MQRKGIILAGGSGTRLRPLTKVISKQLLPVFDKPMVFYPISVMIFAGIKEIAIISDPQSLDLYRNLLGDGSNWGVHFSYIEQPKPEGIAQAFILCEKFLGNNPAMLLLGDNIFYGHDLPAILQKVSAQLDANTIFGYRVADPSRFGVIEFDQNGKVLKIVEKPEIAPSDYAITGMYFLNNKVVEIAKSLRPSQRGELEITDLLDKYLSDDDLNVKMLGRGFAWLDTGTHESLLDASNFVRTLQAVQGLKVGDPAEVAEIMGLI